MKPKSIFLALMVVCAVIGWAQIGPFLFYSMAKPMAAVLFIMVYIMHMVDSASADPGKPAASEPVKIEDGGHHKLAA